jgi:hypothetical protein
MPAKKRPASPKAVSLEAQPLKLPARPTFEEKPEMEEEEHKRWPKPKGRYRPIKELGEPTRVQEASDDSSSTKR